MKLTIEIIKYEVLYDIDANTYKRMESNLAGQPDRVQNALSSDSKEELDKSLLYRYMQTRDAKLRKKLTFCLDKEELTEGLVVTNRLKLDEPSFVYNLNVAEDFSAASADVLASMMHRYIVDGTIFDWYAYQHMESNVSADQLEDMERKIPGLLRKSFASRPLQPFGPAK